MNLSDSGVILTLITLLSPIFVCFVCSETTRIRYYKDLTNGPSQEVIAANRPRKEAGDGDASARSQTAHENRQKFFEKLFQGYDSRIFPDAHANRATVVNCSIFIGSFDSISEVTMDYSMDIYMRQRWYDDRLAFGKIENATSLLSTKQQKAITLDTKMFERLWIPDLFFANEKSAQLHEITIPNRLIRLYPDGRILYSLRVSMTLSCQMDLRKFPHDTQICSLKLESYAYTMNQLVFHWTEKPLEVSNSLMLPQFNLEQMIFGSCATVHTTGNFTCLNISFVLTRDIGYFITQTYIPSVLTVALSWISFWIDPEAVPARVTLGVLTILTITTQSSGLRASLPRVSYVKAIDVWMAACLIFVFAAMIEYAIVNVSLRRSVTAKARRLKKLKRHFAKTSSSMQTDTTAPIVTPTPRQASPSSNVRGRPLSSFSVAEEMTDNYPLGPVDSMGPKKRVTLAQLEQKRTEIAETVIDSPLQEPQPPLHHHHMVSTGAMADSNHRYTLVPVGGEGETEPMLRQQHTCSRGKVEFYRKHRLFKRRQDNEGATSNRNIYHNEPMSSSTQMDWTFTDSSTGPRRRKSVRPNQEPIEDGGPKTGTPAGLAAAILAQDEKDIENQAQVIEMYARALFPSAFILFNLVYWMLYLLWKNHVVPEGKIVGAI